jgi:hypothetical protein
LTPTSPRSSRASAGEHLRPPLASDNAPGNLDDNDRDFVRATSDLSGITNEDVRNDLAEQRGSLLRQLDKNSKVGILRVKRDMGKENNIGFLATAYSFPGRSNYVGGFDSRIRFDKQTTFDFQVLGTNSRRCALGSTTERDDCRTLNGFAYAYNLTQNRRHLGWNLNGVGRTQGYRADVGFTRRLGTNNHRLRLRHGQSELPAREPRGRAVWTGRTARPRPGKEWRVEAGGTYQPTTPCALSLNYFKDRLTRYDTGLVAFDDNIFSLRGTYQFTRFWFARARVDYTTLGSNARGQFLLGWAPNPGTAFYVGYNDDMNRNGLQPVLAATWSPASDATADSSSSRCPISSAAASGSER